MTSIPFLHPAPGNYTDLIATFPRRRPNNGLQRGRRIGEGVCPEEEIAFALFHHKWLQQTGLLIACTYRASVRLDPAAERAP